MVTNIFIAILGLIAVSILGFAIVMTFVSGFWIIGVGALAFCAFLGYVLLFEGRLPQ